MNLIVGFILGALVVTLIWVIVAAANNEGMFVHEIYSGGRCYTTKRAHRIVGAVEETIINGVWVLGIKSLWRAFPTREDDSYRFFILYHNEINPPKVIVVSTDKAKEFVEGCVEKGCVEKELANQLLKDWFNE